MNPYPTPDAVASQAKTPYVGNTRAFTLIEILAVVTIIAVLVGLLLPGIAIIRKRAKVSATKTTISSLAIAMETYHQIDPLGRYPLHEELFPPPVRPPDHLLGVAPLPSYPAGVVGLLFDLQLLALDRPLVGNLVNDGWERPIHYHLRRPAPASGGERLVDWNWDPDASRARLWDRAHDRASPYPYIFSLGTDGSETDASHWIYHAP